MLHHNSHDCQTAKHFAISVKNRRFCLVDFKCSDLRWNSSNKALSEKYSLEILSLKNIHWETSSSSFTEKAN